MSPDRVIARVVDYLDAVGRPNEPIAQTARRDPDGETAYPRRYARLFAADLAALLDIARTATGLQDATPEDFRKGT
jgi:hypothetical protein